MISTKIPELTKKQTAQLVKDIKTPASKDELEKWRKAIEVAKSIKSR
jgi:hypothetical protein